MLGSLHLQLKKKKRSSSLIERYSAKQAPRYSAHNSNTEVFITLIIVCITVASKRPSGDQGSFMLDAEHTHNEKQSLPAPKNIVLNSQVRKRKDYYTHFTDGKIDTQAK